MLPISFADTLNLIYDKNGNLQTGDGFYREYNSLNQLWKVYNGSDTSGWLMQEYTYHPTEERVLIKKTYNSSGTLTETVYYISKEFIQIINETGTFNITYIYHEGQLVAERDNDGTKTFYHPDHLGSTSLTTDGSGNLVENTFYTPYGLILSGGSSRFDYEGKEFDSLINQYDFHFRGYKAEWGKFTQPDSLLPNVYDPQLLNRYAFERNNPYRYTDPDGHAIPQVLIIAGIYVAGVVVISTGGGLIGSLIGAVSGGFTETTKAFEELEEEGIRFKETITSSEIRKAILKETGRGIASGARSGFVEGFFTGLEATTPIKGLSQAYSSYSTAQSVGQPSQLNIPSYSYSGISIQPTHYGGGGSSGYISSSSGIKVGYTITEKEGKATGGSIGNIKMSEGFANLFKKYFGSKKSSSKSSKK